MDRPKVPKRCCVCGKPLPRKKDSDLRVSGTHVFTEGDQTFYACGRHTPEEINRRHQIIPVFTTGDKYSRGARV